MPPKPDVTTAKKSINAFAAHCKARIAEAEGFVLANDDTGITTPKIKRQATKILGNLRDQFNRMKIGWNGITVAFSRTFEEPVQTALEELQIVFGDIQWIVEDVEEKIMSMLDEVEEDDVVLEDLDEEFDEEEEDDEALS